jgi:hypothetical protein
MIKKDAHELHKANWENQTSKVIEKKQITNKNKLLKEQRTRFLDIRRKKLANLLMAEEEEFKQEIIAIQETPDQVRAKMETKLKSLKEEREKERVELVKHLEERRFYESADELRKNDSEAFAIECYLEQENQMLDKLKKREHDRREEEVYVNLTNFEMLKKIEKEKKQLLEKQEKEKKIYDFRDWQLRTQELEFQKAHESKQHEVSRLREQWEKDKLCEEEEKHKNKEINKIVYRDIEEFNKREESERNKRTQFEKLKDRELIESILDKENALDEIDRREKEKRRNEFNQNKIYLEYIMNQKKEAELWMDKLAKQEQDKQWIRTQQQWMKEEEAKIELLKQVYADRENSVKNKSII